MGGASANRLRPMPGRRCREQSQRKAQLLPCSTFSHLPPVELRDLGQTCLEVLFFQVHTLVLRRVEEWDARGEAPHARPGPRRVRGRDRGEARRPLHDTQPHARGAAAPGRRLVRFRPPPPATGKCAPPAAPAAAAARVPRYQRPSQMPQMRLRKAGTRPARLLLEFGGPNLVGGWGGARLGPHSSGATVTAYQL
jgi:hypothetical protein